MGLSYEEAVLEAREKMGICPTYSYIAAVKLKELLLNEVKNCLNLAKREDTADDYYYRYMLEYLNYGVKVGRLDPKLLTSFDLLKIAASIDPTRDEQFTYLGLQTLYDRYLLQHEGKRYELPQMLFMRVAMGCALNEETPTEWALKFYKIISTFRYMPSTPTLFNAGTIRPQLSSCFLSTIGDDLAEIYDGIKTNALLTKWAGGVANDWTPVRAAGSHIAGTNGESQGIIPFLKVVNDTAIAVNQGGKRKGATCCYLEVWHLDIEDFIDLRKSSGDERRRTYDMNTAVWIPDLFMQRVEQGGEWTLFSPDSVPALHDTYGDMFETRYIYYEAQNHGAKTIKAVALWRKILGALFETGHPWVCFKDTINKRSPQKHCGVVHSSNLCTEITLNTSKEEIAVCNLGSINLVKHYNSEYHHGIDTAILEDTIAVAMRMLDNIIDLNYYAVHQALVSNFKHRPVGLGMMGFQDLLHQMQVPYDSARAVCISSDIQEEISYYAIAASIELAKERGSYGSYEGSDWSKGILPKDTPQRGEVTTTMDWDTVYKGLAQHGMRNSNVMAIAPTATISNICGVSQSIEPTYKLVYTKSNLSGDFIEINKYLVNTLVDLNLWTENIRQEIKATGGSIQQIERIPKYIRDLFKTAFELEPEWLIKCAAARQVFIDQSQSLNIYMAHPTGKKLHEVYMMAWKIGLKTTYYLRSLGAAEAVNVPILGEGLPKACKVDDPDCEACQ